MTRVYCTKKLKDYLGDVDEKLPDNYHDIKSSDWNAHLFFIDNRKCIVFVNNLTFYSVFLRDIVKKDLKNIDQIFESRLKEQLLHDGVVDNFEKAKFLTDGRLEFIKTNNNKRIIGRINDYVDAFKGNCFYKYHHVHEMDVPYENGLINETPTGTYIETKKSWSDPIQNIKELIKTSA